jgi:D-glutamate cyclase
MPEIAGEQADRLITVEIRNRGIPIGVTRPLYEAARAEGGGRPLTLRAAEGLVDKVRRGSNVFIITGAGTPPLLPKGENDGPVGAAVLARALYRGIGATPIYVVEEHHVDPVVASSEAAGVRVVDYAVAKEKHLGAALLTAPTEESRVADWAASIFETYKPAAVIAIERLGPNEKGIIHGATGIAGWKPMVDVSPVIAEAERRGIFTVGVGDHGNELGFGRIHSAVKKIHPAGGKCRCPCGAGMATVIKTDVLVTATMSNWGCYGIEAMLAFLLKQPNLVHTPEMERRIIYACLDADGLEALFCTRLFIVDGADGESSVSVVQMLGDLVHSALVTPDSGPAH